MFKFIQTNVYRRNKDPCVDLLQQLRENDKFWISIRIRKKVIHKNNVRVAYGTHLKSIEGSTNKIILWSEKYTFSKKLKKGQ